jgi:hypothetical protein
MLIPFLFKADEPTKRAPVARHGVNTITTLIEKKKAQLVIIANDVDPIEVSYCWNFHETFDSCARFYLDRLFSYGSSLAASLYFTLRSYKV